MPMQTYTLQLKSACISLELSYLWWDIVDVVVSPISSLFSFPGEVVDVLGGVSPSPKAGGDVVDLLGSLADSAPVAMEVFVCQDGGRDVVHVLGDRRLVVIFIVEVVVQVLARRDGGLGFEFGKVWGYVVGLFSDWLTIRNVFTNRWGEVIDLKEERQEIYITHFILLFFSYLNVYCMT